MQGGFLLDVVVRQGTSIFQLLASEDQSLLVRWNTLLQKLTDGILMQTRLVDAFPFLRFALFSRLLFLDMLPRNSVCIIFLLILSLGLFGV